MLQVITTRIITLPLSGWDTYRIAKGTVFTTGIHKNDVINNGLKVRIPGVGVYHLFIDEDIRFVN
jgi:hypothetical protein